MTLIGAPSVSQQGLYFSLKAVSLLLSTVIIGFLFIIYKVPQKLKSPPPMSTKFLSYPLP